MSFLTINNVKIVGLAACVPPTIEENLTLPIFENEAEARRVIESTGIERKRVVEAGTTASDLSYQGINKLLGELEWSPDSIDALIYVCTSRDYIAPITSAILQDRLGFRKDCYCLDLPLGCSGWVYGMSNLSSLLSHGQLKRGLLVCAETNSLNRSAKDKTVKPLFGDAATITALEFDENWDKPMQFSFGVDGSGYKAVWTEFGGTRNPITPEAIEEKEIEPGIIRKGIDMVVNGMDVFAFAIKVPPLSLSEFIEHFNIDTEKVDYLFLHQANKFIDDRIRKRLKMPEEKVPFCLQDFGNTNSASIPLTMVVCKTHELMNGHFECLGCGFGIGLAWASIHYYVENLKAVVLTEYEY
ncbi:MAG: ketoacyl-ACP synthase III [Veillonella sp.]|nr:ketoacyl-ACP synthase III [Veillonella sp.]